MTDLRQSILAALRDFDTYPLPEAATRLFGTLGYKSDRVLPISTVTEFCEQWDGGHVLTSREREAIGDDSRRCACCAPLPAVAAWGEGGFHASVSRHSPQGDGGAATGFAAADIGNRKKRRCARPDWEPMRSLRDREPSSRKASSFAGRLRRTRRRPRPPEGGD